MNYEQRELARVLDSGPARGEDWYRLKVTGATETRWLSISAEQLAALVDWFEGADQ